MGLHISDIYDFYKKGHYDASCLPEFKDKKFTKLPDDHIFDEDLSVRRNREMVAEYNQEVDNLKTLRRSKQMELTAQLADDVVAYIKEYYNLTEAQAKCVQSWTYIEKHSSMCDYFASIDSFADFAERLVNMEE